MNVPALWRASFARTGGPKIYGLKETGSSQSPDAPIPWLAAMSFFQDALAYNLVNYAPAGGFSLARAWVGRIAWLGLVQFAWSLGLLSRFVLGQSAPFQGGLSHASGRGPGRLGSTNTRGREGGGQRDLALVGRMKAGDTGPYGVKRVAI